jgi:uroporphyrinogen decarboxylase
MTSKERMMAALNLEEPDMIPIAPYMHFWYAAKASGYTISEYELGTNKFQAKLLLNAQKKFGYDWIMASGGHEHGWRENVDIRDENDRYVITPKEEGYSLGRWSTKHIVPKDDAPYYLTSTDGYLKNIEDYAEMPITDAETIYRRGELEPMEIISRRIGDKVLVVGHLGSPFGAGADIVGLNQWILALYKKPDLAEKVMKQSIEQSLEMARAEIKAGAEAFFIEEAFAGTDTISPKLYEKFGFPHEKEHINRLNKLGIPTILSFTGDPMPIIDKIIETGPTAHHFEESKKGFTVDVYKIRAKLRGNACMFLPFDAVYLLPSNDLMAIEREAVQIVSRTAEGGGVVLSTGCPILKDTSEESIDTMIKTARETSKTIY